MADVSGRTIQRWGKKFSDLVNVFASMIKLPHGIGAMSVDEKGFKSRGVSRYLFEVMSVRSRYIVNHDAAEDKLNYDVTNLIRRAIERTGMPLILPSDRLGGFRTAHKSVTDDAKSQTLYLDDAGINKVHVNNN